jgi:RNA polymerase sigma-70 factor (ECF subfamily)
LDVPPHAPVDRSISADAGTRAPWDVTVLTRRMVEGDEAAYRKFYEDYFDRLGRYLLVVTAGNEDAMREALQATLVRVVRYIKVFRDETVFWSWLTVLARSAWADENRKRRRYLAFLDRFTHQAHVESDRAGPDQADERLQQLLDRSLALLPEDDRQLVEWKYHDRRSAREIAAELQTSEKAIESRLVRIRRKVKDIVLAQLKNEPLS